MMLCSTGHVARKEKIRTAYTDKPLGKRPLGRPSCRWKHNIKMYDMKGCEDGRWIRLAHPYLTADVSVSGVETSGSDNRVLICQLISNVYRG
jgi:hypothetical protein